MRRLIVAMALLSLTPAVCLAEGSAKTWVKKGNLLYNKGNYPEALKNYEEAFLASPDSDIVNYDIGAALYKNENYQESVTHFEKSLLSEDEALRKNASYNIGNSKYKIASGKQDEDLNGAIDLMKQSLRHYENALSVDSDDEDVKFNYEFVKKELERLEKELQSQQSDQNKEGSEEDREVQENQEGQEDQNSSRQDQKGPKEDSPEENSSQSEGSGQKDDQDAQKESLESIKSAEDNDEDEKESGLDREPSGYKTDKEGISQEEAKMLLDIYSQEEEPKTLYKERLQTRDLPEVTKDW